MTRSHRLMEWNVFFHLQTVMLIQKTTQLISSQTNMSASNAKLHSFSTMISLMEVVNAILVLPL